jgi:hypothetical protein
MVMMVVDVAVVALVWLHVPILTVLPVQLLLHRRGEVLRDLDLSHGCDVKVRVNGCDVTE